MPWILDSLLQFCSDRGPANWIPHLSDLAVGMLCSLEMTEMGVCCQGLLQQIVRLTWISQTSLVPGPTSLPIRVRNPNISQSGDSKAQRGQLQKRLLGQPRVLPSRRLHIHLKLWAVDHWGTESVKHCSCGWVRIDITCFKMNRYASTSDCLISHQPLTSFKKGSVQCQGQSVSFCRVWK